VNEHLKGIFSSLEINILTLILFKRINNAINPYNNFEMCIGIKRQCQEEMSEDLSIEIMRCPFTLSIVYFEEFRIHGVNKLLSIEDFAKFFVLSKDF